MRIGKCCCCCWGWVGSPLVPPSLSIFLCYCWMNYPNGRTICWFATHLIGGQANIELLGKGGFWFPRGQSPGRCPEGTGGCDTLFVAIVQNWRIGGWRESNEHRIIVSRKMGGKEENWGTSPCSGQTFEVAVIFISYFSQDGTWRGGERRRRKTVEMWRVEMGLIEGPNAWMEWILG